MNKRGAFTLIELLVAVTILLILLTLLFSISGQMMRLSDSAIASSERIENAGSALDSIRHDLVDASAPLNPTNTPNLQFLLNPPLSQVPQEFQRPSAAFWQIPATVNTNSGDLVSVGYFVRWDTTVPTNPRPILCRLQVNPDDPLNLLYSSSAWLSESILSAKAGGTKNENYAGFVAEGIVSLWIRAVNKDGTTAIAWDSRTPVPGRLPDALDVRIVVVDSHTLRRLSTIPTYPQISADNFENEVTNFIQNLPPEIRSGARIFQTLIPLNAAREKP